MASFGRELPDQVDLLDRRTGAQLVLLQDIQSVIRERASLEANYAKTLLAISKKTEKLNRQHITAGVLGDNPSKLITDEALKRSTLETALSFLAESFDKTAQEHLSYSEVLNVQVADELRSLERKKEETRKKHATFYNKLVADRDIAYSDRSKAQQKYYSDCEELETYRQKQDRATDDKHADRAAKLHEQMHVSMLDRKNTYLVAISVSNKVKDLFYSESVPAVEDQYQVLQTSVTSRLINILQNYSAFTTSHLSTLTQTVEILQKTLGGVDHSKDHELFIEYNRRPFTVPSDWSFEPCPSFYDTADMSIEPEPKLFLQNKLARSQAKLAELQPVLEAKQQDTSRLNELVEAYTADAKLGSVDAVLDDAFAAVHIVAHLTAQRAVYEEEERSIVRVLGDDYGSQAPHSFKSSSFAVPTLCAYCKTNIWGLSKQGKTCKMCGITVHSKCELKIPAACTGTQPGGTSRRKSTLGRRNMATTQIPPPGTSSIHSFANSQGLYLTTPRGESALNAQNGSAFPGMAATILFDFESSSTFELTVSSGTQVQIIEDDDGSGWVKVSDGRKNGLVPASYLSMDESSSSPTSSIKAKAGPRATKKKKVRGLYAYDAQGDDELSVIEGGTLELTPGGEDYADGWYQGVDPRGKIGIFPSNYVEFI